MTPTASAMAEHAGSSSVPNQIRTGPAAVLKNAANPHTQYQNELKEQKDSYKKNIITSHNSNNLFSKNANAVLGTNPKYLDSLKANREAYLRNYNISPNDKLGLI